MRQSNAVGGLWLREPAESETTAGARDHGGGLRSQPKQRWSAETIVQTWWSRRSTVASTRAASPPVEVRPLRGRTKCEAQWETGRAPGAAQGTQVGQGGAASAASAPRPGGECGQGCAASASAPGQLQTMLRISSEI